MAENEEFFNVRDLVIGSHLHNASIQAQYDNVNRMALLYANIRFHDLFTQRWDQLIPRIASQLKTAGDLGLIADPDAAGILLNKLKASYDWMTYQKLYDHVKPGTYSFPECIGETSFTLWQIHGISLPEISGKLKRNMLAKEAVGELLKSAGEFTYREVYETPVSAMSGQVWHAIHMALESHIIPYAPGNGLCCACQNGHCVCTRSISTDFCALVGGQCSGAANRC